MICPVCDLPRSECVACGDPCGDPCPACGGAGELIDNPGWPDPQHERRFDCPTCKGTGVHNPDLNSRPETYTESWLRYTREDTAGALFDEAFDELLARQDRFEEYAGRQVTSGAQAPVTVMKGGGENSEAGRSPELGRATPLAQIPPRTMTGGRIPSRPPVSEDAERKAA